MPTDFDPAIGSGTRWKKGGPSPNPGGRPRTKMLSDALRSKLGEHKPGDPDGRTYAEVVAANLVELACSQGRNAVAAISEIVDRTEGRARQSIEIADVTRDLQLRSDQDLQYFLEHGRWPEIPRETLVTGDN
jgi:hypothetical protein